MAKAKDSEKGKVDEVDQLISDLKKKSKQLDAQTAELDEKAKSLGKMEKDLKKHYGYDELSQSAKSKGLKIKEGFKIKNEEAEVLSEYFMGLCRDCPFEYVTLAGHTIHKFTDSVQVTSTHTNRVSQKGQVVRISDAEIDKIMIASQRKMVRPMKGGASGRMYTHDSKTYVEEPGDYPIGMKIFITPMKDLGPNFRDADYECLIHSERKAG